MKTCPTCRRSYEDDSAYCPHDGDRLRRPSSARLGTVLGDQLRLDAPIGQGAMGAVYRGVQLGIERAVAIKLLHPELAGVPDLRARFLREARAAARLAGPHIAAVHLVGEADDGVPYIAMELIDGTSLEEVAAAAPIPPGRAVELARQIALALADAHDAGVVHRDLKPSNVMIDVRRGVERAVVLDFGIAKLDGGDAAATRDGQLCGTPGYLAPEQAEGHAVAASDLYSLGVILYRLLSGAMPFDGDGVPLIVAHLIAPPRPLPDEVDGELADLVMACLAKDPARRPAGAAALTDALARIGHRLASAADATPVERRARGSRRRVRAVLGGVAALLLSTASGGPSSAGGAVGSVAGDDGDRHLTSAIAPRLEPTSVVAPPPARPAGPPGFI